MKDDLPKGFLASSCEANFKKPGRDDLALIVSDRPCSLAALFTKNIFCAAPVQVCKKILASHNPVRAIIANAGQANACTGDEGLNNCHEIQNILATDLQIKADEILPVSTGVIGVQFDMDKWRKALKTLVKKLGNTDAEGFTRAFMTTDAFPKFTIDDIEMSTGKVRLTVMAKGAGMICPDMATMLCVALTDALMEPSEWQHYFNLAVQKTFNRVSVDGDTSTNDTIFGLANGATGIAPASGEDKLLFAGRLQDAFAKVAYMLVKDGEGARKVLHIHVKGAKTEQDAWLVARAIANSQLVKTAIYGEDANWGRIVNAVGYSGTSANPHEISLKLCGIERFKYGQPINEELENEISERLKKADIDIEITLGNGKEEYSMLSSDLGHEYVSLNADYRS